MSLVPWPLHHHLTKLGGGGAYGDPAQPLPPMAVLLPPPQVMPDTSDDHHGTPKITMEHDHVSSSSNAQSLGRNLVDSDEDHPTQKTCHKHSENLLGLAMM